MLPYPLSPSEACGLYWFIVSLSLIDFSKLLSFYRNVFDTILPYHYRTILTKLSIRYPTLTWIYAAEPRVVRFTLKMVTLMKKQLTRWYTFDLETESTYYGQSASYRAKPVNVDDRPEDIGRVRGVWARCSQRWPTLLFKTYDTGVDRYYPDASSNFSPLVNCNIYSWADIAEVRYSFEVGMLWWFPPKDVRKQQQRCSYSYTYLYYYRMLVLVFISYVPGTK